MSLEVNIFPVTYFTFSKPSSPTPFYTPIPVLTYTDKKEHKIFLIYKEIHIRSVAKSYCTRSFLISLYVRKILFYFLLVYPVHFCSSLRLILGTEINSVINIRLLNTGKTSTCHVKGQEREEREMATKNSLIKYKFCKFKILFSFVKSKTHSFRKIVKT